MGTSSGAGEGGRLEDAAGVSEAADKRCPVIRVWTRGADVMATWRRYGFVPPSEYREDYFFKINRERTND